MASIVGVHGKIILLYMVLYFLKLEFASYVINVKSADAMIVSEKLYKQFIGKMPIVCVDLLIEYNHHILLVQRKHEPLKGELFLPGGRLFKGESLEECALRKAKEEVGKEDCLLGPMIHYQSTIYPQVHSVNFCFLLMAVNNKVVLDDTSSAYEWIYIENVQPVNSYMENCIKVLKRD